MRTKQELRAIAEGIQRNEIFTDRHIPPHDKEHMLGSIFMPLLFANDDVREQIKNAHTLFAYMKDAGPHSINGYPCFFNLEYLDKADSVTVWTLYEKFNKAAKFAGLSFWNRLKLHGKEAYNAFVSRYFRGVCSENPRTRDSV